MLFFRCPLIFPLIVWEELGEAARLDLLLEEVKLVEEHDEGLSLEVDVVNDGGEEVQALVHPVCLIVLVQELKRSRHMHGSNQIDQMDGTTRHIHAIHLHICSVSLSPASD